MVSLNTFAHLLKASFTIYIFYCKFTKYIIRKLYFHILFIEYFMFFFFHVAQGCQTLKIHIIKI